MKIPSFDLFAEDQVERAVPTVLHAESISVRNAAQDWSFDSHRHNDLHQFFWVTKGSGRVTIDGVTRGFSANTAFFIPALTVHGFQFTQGSLGWVITVSSRLPAPLSLPQGPVQTLVSNPDEQRTLTNICDEINRELLSDNPAKDAALGCQAGLLSVWFVRHLTARNILATQKNSSRRRLMRGFTQMLEESFRDQASVSHYAGKLSVTPTHLTRVCRQTTGKSATSLIQDRTILEARRKLAYSDQRIADVAKDLGFSSAAYFTRLYSAKTGEAPSAFRKHARSLAMAEV